MPHKRFPTFAEALNEARAAMDALTHHLHVCTHLLEDETVFGNRVIRLYHVIDLADGELRSLMEQHAKNNKPG